MFKKNQIEIKINLFPLSFESFIIRAHAVACTLLESTLMEYTRTIYIFIFLYIYIYHMQSTRHRTTHPTDIYTGNIKYIYIMCVRAYRREKNAI